MEPSVPSIPSSPRVAALRNAWFGVKRRLGLSRER
jgi:hypothetical protein